MKYSNHTTIETLNARRLHARLCACVALLFLLLVFAGESLSAPRQSPAGMLGEGNPWATPWYSIEGDEPGPVVVVTGGVHGNEPAGSHAALEVLAWPIRRGRLIVVPRVNRLGLAADMRWFPPTRNDRERRDLNRNFPTEAGDAPLAEINTALWELIERQDPDYVIDLHEGFDFHVANPESVGSSIIYSNSEQRDALAGHMLEAVNAIVEDDARRFVPLRKSGAAMGSLVRSATDVLGADAFILETTFKDQPISRRTRQHRTMVSTLLEKIGMIDHACVDMLVPDADDDTLRVALFDGDGASAQGLVNLSRALEEDHDVVTARVGPADMRSLVLEQFDVVLFPGGSGSKQGRAIGETGREAVRGFARDGGGIVGVCAGAYLCSAHYDWSLHVINTTVFNTTLDIPGVGRKSMWYRGGPHDVRMEFTEAAADVLGRAGEVTVRYQNGPIVSRGHATDLPETTALAWFRSEVVRYEPQRGTMVDTPAILTADFGEGRVVSISPHPEGTPGLESVITHAVRWASREPQAVGSD